MSLPRYRTKSGDRIQLVYQSDDMAPVTPPTAQYILNALVPEQEVCNVCCALTSLISPFIGSGIERLLPVSGTLLKQYTKDEGIWQSMVMPYRQIENEFEHPMSGIYSQIFNHFGLGNSNAVYVIRPNNYQIDKSYPLVVFCHGYLGNWLNYTGVLKRLDDVVVLCVPTKDLSGIFTEKDIADIFDKQVPFVESLGYNIDHDNIHLMGLSNGGTAANIAYNQYSTKLKSITFISCEAHNTKRIGSKVNLCGGALDGSSIGLPSASKRMKRNGIDVDILWKEDFNHYMMVRNQDDFVDFINNRLK